MTTNLELRDEPPYNVELRAENERLLTVCKDKTDLLRDAYAQIERLRAEKAQWQPIYQALDRDRARLRAALLQIAIDDKDQAVTRAQCRSIALAAIHQQQAPSPPDEDWPSHGRRPARP